MVWQRTRQPKLVGPRGLENRIKELYASIIRRSVLLRWHSIRSYVCIFSVWTSKHIEDHSILLFRLVPFTILDMQNLVNISFLISYSRRHLSDLKFRGIHTLSNFKYNHNIFQAQIKYKKENCWGAIGFPILTMQNQLFLL